MKSFGRLFHERKHTEPIFKRWPRLYLALPPELGGVGVTWVALVLKARKGYGEQKGLRTMRSQKKHIGEGVPSVGVEASKLKGS